MANVTEHYVDIDNLKNTITYILDINSNIESNQTRILEKLQSLKNSIMINGNKINNRSDEVEKAMDNYLKNYMGCINSFKATITKYETAVSNSVTYINNNL